ncbi:MAG: hypothetical protein R2717_05775 [Schumannella sp.]
MNDKEKLITAYHEGGHALAAAASMRYTDPVTKVTIRRAAEGWATMVLLPGGQVPCDAQRVARPARLHAMGGRVAEEIVPRPDDRRIQRHREVKATAIARRWRTRRHERQHRRGQAGAVRRRGLPRPRHGGHQRDYSRRSPRRSTSRCTLSSRRHDEWKVLNDNRDILDNLAKEPPEGDADLTYSRGDLHERQEARRAPAGLSSDSAR